VLTARAAARRARMPSVPRPLRLRVPQVLVLLALLVLPSAVPSLTRAADVPRERQLYADGPTGRHLLGGRWLFRLDPQDQGERARWQRETGTEGWTPATVPSAWNTGDESYASMSGGVGWYRKDFTLPDARAALRWIVRFESVNYRSTVWLNGRRVGKHRGAYIPFEFVLGAGLSRRGTNRLVVRVDSRRRRYDFPPAGLNSAGVPTGGWWNYSGPTREVYLRRVDTVDLEHVVVRPRLSCRSCDARVDLSTRARNVSARARRVTVTGRVGGRRVMLGSRVLGARAAATFRGRLTVRDPKLWSPTRPTLYRAALEASAGGRRVARHVLRTGIKDVRVRNARLELNFAPVSLRGVGYHEDDRAEGFALSNASRERLVAEAKALGATIMRTHYPPHPHLHELADREGMLLWSEVPVYAVPSVQLNKRLVRRTAAKEIEKNIRANQNHASVLLWSVGNELDSSPGPGVRDYLAEAAARVRRLDPSRPVAYAFAGYLTAGCQARAYAPFDVLGINEYFGWYTGPGGQIFDRTRLPAYLDSMRACYDRQALMVAEFGAEANRDGPVEEKGTWAFQQDFVNYHLGVYASKPWLSGALYWALNEFRVRPAWQGGNPRPQPPIHQKGLTRYGTWERKPAWEEVRRRFAEVRQLGR